MINREEYKKFLLESRDTLGKYYERWFHDTRKSAEFCRQNNQEASARDYEIKHEVLNEVLLQK